MSKTDAAAKFQLLLVKYGAQILFPDPDLIDSDSKRNVFNYD
jgi:hypothetical protein